MPKTKIKITDADNNVLLYGITTQLDDYKLSWLFNNELKINLKKVDNYLTTKKGITEELLFSAYQTDTDNIVIDLVSNKNENSIRLINLPTVDFLLKINNISFDVKDFTSKIRNLQGIIAVTDIRNNPNIQKKILKEITDFLK